MKYLSKFDSYEDYERLDEALYLKEKMREVLKVMSSPIANELLNLKTSLKDFSFNLLNLADKNDVVSFSNKSHMKFKIISTGHIYRRPHYHVDDAELLAQKLIEDGAPENILSNELKDGDIGTIKKVYTSSECGEFNLYHGTEFAHFISDSGEHGLLFHAPWKPSSGLTPVASRKPTNGRIGRVIRRILNESGYDYVDKDIEAFVNEFKSKFDILGDIDSLFEIVSGEQLLHYYHFKQYDNTSSCTLQGSCMRHEGCQEYLEIYSENPKQVNLLVLKSIFDPKKISARAILWKLKDGKTIMDRVYCSKNHEVDIFTNYAIKNGWYFKKRQDSSSHTDIVNSKSNDAQNLESPIIISLDKAIFDYYPYADTFKYLKTSSGKISNRPIAGGDGFLESVDGELNEGEDCEYCGGTEEIECGECYGSGEIECGECSGSGEIECEECYGDGEVECSECEGEGEIDCDDCEGEGEIDCTNCDGNGELDGDECSECEGTGKSECEYCSTNDQSTGKRDCPDCGGGGKEQCDECDGDGERDCDECSGTGEISCDECDGDGYRTCYEC